MQSRSIAPHGQALVTKHNKLIQARYALSLQEKRLILWLVSAIRPGDTDFHSYRVSVRALAELLGVEKNKNIYAQVAAVTRRLMRRVIEIETLDEQRFLQIHWISSAEYHRGKGYVDLCFDPKLKPYLLHLKDQFTSIALQYAIQLHSVYAIRIYELLKQYQRLKQRTLAVAELRRMLAIDEHKYTLIKDFRRRVIDIAQREINAKTDLCFEYEPIKTGRKITHFRFRIAANMPVPPPAVADQAGTGQTGAPPRSTRGDPGRGGPADRELRAGADRLAPRRAAAAAEEPPPDRQLRRLAGAGNSRRLPATTLDVRARGRTTAHRRPRPRRARRSDPRGPGEDQQGVSQLPAAGDRNLPRPAPIASPRGLRWHRTRFSGDVTSNFAREQFQTNGWREPTLFNDAAIFLSALSGRFSTKRPTPGSTTSAGSASRRFEATCGSGATVRRSTCRRGSTVRRRQRASIGSMPNVAIARVLQERRRCRLGASCLDRSPGVSCLGPATPPSSAA